MIYKPLVSIIIPTYNEKEDVRLSLNAAIKFEYLNKEIIVVDDSTDETPDIVKEYEKYGVRLIRRNIRSNGCCGARNLGILEAKGEIVVLLNADVFPLKDFIDKILSHYENGADYVLVKSKVANPEYLFPRFIEAEGCYDYDGQNWIEWTEGFSCRRQAALDIGLIPGNFPIPFCRDWLLGLKLRGKYRKVIDTSIVVPHIAPKGTKEYWRIRENRGKFSALFQFFIGTADFNKVKKGANFSEVITKRPFYYLVLRTLAKHIKMVGWIIIFLPSLWECLKYTRCSPRKYRDIIPFWIAYVIAIFAFIKGEWKGYFEALKRRSDHQCP